LIGTVSMFMTVSSAAASEVPGTGCMRGCNGCEASKGFATSRPWNCVRNLAAASRIAA